MAGLGRVEEEGGCACGGKAGSDFLADMTGFADAGDDHIAVGRHDEVCRPDDGLINAGFQFLQRVPLDADHVTRKLDLCFGFQGRLPTGFAHRRLPEWEGSSSLGRVFGCL